MPKPRDAEEMRRAQREVGENLPDAMIGEDSEDVRDVERRRHAAADEPASSGARVTSRRRPRSR